MALVDTLAALADDALSLLVERPGAAALRPFVSERLLLGLGDAAGPPLAEGEELLPVGPVIDLIKALIAELEAFAAELPPPHDMTLRRLIEYLQRQAKALGAAGGFIARSKLELLIRYVTGRLAVIMEGLTGRFAASRLLEALSRFAVGIAETAGARLGARILFYLARFLLAFGVGVLIGYLILQIPVGGGRKVWDVLDSELLSDLFSWAFFSPPTECEPLYALFLRARGQRRLAERAGLTGGGMILLREAELRLLEGYLAAGCLTEAQAGPLRLLARRLREALDAQR